MVIIELAMNRTTQNKGGRMTNEDTHEDEGFLCRLCTPVAGSAQEAL